MSAEPPVIDPVAANFSTSGGTSVHTFGNPTATRMAIKLKTSDNALYKVVPVFAFIDPGTQINIEITRGAGPAKEDKMIVQYASGEGLNTPQEAFVSGQPYPDLPIALTCQ